MSKYEQERAEGYGDMTAKSYPYLVHKTAVGAGSDFSPKKLGVYDRLLDLDGELNLTSDALTSLYKKLDPYINVNAVLGENGQASPTATSSAVDVRIDNLRDAIITIRQRIYYLQDTLVL